MMNISIPGYEITGTIASGGMSQVYLAQQQRPSREVALKVLDQSLADNDEFGERFLRETNIIASLPHPNIVPVYDAGSVGRHYYLSMEYLKGGSLSDRIEKGISLNEAIQYTLDIAEALSFAHDQGFIHRDIKPDNILFRTQAKSAVLSDFGIARSSTNNSDKNAATNKDLTQVNFVIGTPKYMSPQQAMGEPLTGQSDIFSLGLVFFEMLCGKPPYDAQNIGALCVQHQDMGLQQLPASLSAVQAIMTKMLALDLADRYSNINAVIEDLQNFRAKLPTSLSTSANRPLTRVMPINTPDTQKPSDIQFTNNNRYTKPQSETKPSQTDHTRKSIVLIALGAITLMIGSVLLVNLFQAGNQDNPQALVSDTTQLQTPNTHYVSPKEISLYQDAVTTKDRSLADSYLQQYPNSPFRHAIKHLLNLSSLEDIAKIAEHGDVAARISLAEIYDNQLSDKKSEALRWSSLTTEQNIPLGDTQYAILLLSKENPEGKDIDQAISLLKGAADRGFYLAKSTLAGFYLSGRYVTRNLDTGITLLKEAAELKDPYAMDVLIQIYSQGYESISADIQLVEYYKSAKTNL